MGTLGINLVLASELGLAVIGCWLVFMLYML